MTEQTEEDLIKVARAFMADLNQAIDDRDEGVLSRIQSLAQMLPLLDRRFDVECVTEMHAFLDAHEDDNKAEDELLGEVASQLRHLQHDPAPGFPQFLEGASNKGILQISIALVGLSYIRESLDFVRDQDARSYIAAIHACWVEGFVYRGLLDQEIARRKEESQ